MTRALEKTYDGIIIGAGRHGLILGSYLAKAGLNVLLVDRRLHYGGGLSTEEATAPGTPVFDGHGDEAIQSREVKLDCFAELVIGPALRAGRVGWQ